MPEAARKEVQDVEDLPLVLSNDSGVSLEVTAGKSDTGISLIDAEVTKEIQRSLAIGNLSGEPENMMRAPEKWRDSRKGVWTDAPHNEEFPRLAEIGDSENT